MHEGKEGGNKILRIIAGLRGRLGVGAERHKERKWVIAIKAQKKGREELAILNTNHSPQHLPVHYRHN